MTTTKAKIRAHMVASRMPPLALASPNARRLLALRQARDRYAGRPALRQRRKAGKRAPTGVAVSNAGTKFSDQHRARMRASHLASPRQWGRFEVKLQKQWDRIQRVLAFEETHWWPAWRRREREQEKRVARMRLRLVRQLCRLLRRRIARAEIRDPVYGGKPQWQGGIPCASLAEAMFVGVMLSRGREIRRYTGPPLPWRDADGRERAWSPDFQETRTGTLYEVKGINELPTFPKPEQVAANREWFADVVWKCRAHPDVVLWNGRSAATQREYQRAVRDGLVTASVPMSAAEFCVATG